MTFPEAGIQILEQAGRPLYLQEIVAKAIQDGLLSHVGQIPEQTMRERLLALAKRTSDRKLIVVGPGQFALTDWGLPEDEGALAESERPEDPSVEKPLRGRERHPPISKPSGARGDAGPRSSNAKKKRRLPPLSAVVAELLGEVGAKASLEQLLDRGREKGLMSDELARDALLSALSEENRRRIRGGRTGIFELADGQVTLLSSDGLQVLKGDAGRELAEGPLDRFDRIEHQPYGSPSHVLESRRQTARNLRRRVQELSNSALERLALLLIGKGGYRDLRAVRLAGAERERLFVARRRLGLSELRFLCHFLPVGREATRESVQALRAWMAESEAHAGIVIGPGEATREARAESQRVGAPLLSLLCGDAFIEELVLRQVGVVSYEATAVDDAFWRTFRKGPEKAAGIDSPQEPPTREGRSSREPRDRARRVAGGAPATKVASAGDSELRAAAPIGLPPPPASGHEPLEIAASSVPPSSEGQPAEGSPGSASADLQQGGSAHNVQGDGPEKAG